MKVIDLTNRLLFLDDIIQIYKESHYYYVLTKNGTYNIYESDYFKIKNYLLSLNDEVEILEEKKTPEKITMRAESVGDVNNKIENLNINQITIEDKINEIIDYLDYLKSKGE